MGTLYNFRCSKCGYTAEVSGGKDCGFYDTVRTMICNNCKELVDVFVGVFGEEYEDLTSLKGIINSEDDIKRFRKCPECLDDKFLRPWNPIKKFCPRCGSKMNREKEPIVFWD